MSTRKPTWIPSNPNIISYDMTGYWKWDPSSYNWWTQGGEIYWVPALPVLDTDKWVWNEELWEWIYIGEPITTTPGCKLCVIIIAIISLGGFLL